MTMLPYIQISDKKGLHLVPDQTAFREQPFLSVQILKGLRLDFPGPPMTHFSLFICIIKLLG